MGRRGAAAVAASMALAASGCGGSSDAPAPSVEPIPLAESPAEVREGCAAARSPVPVLCPQEWPQLDDSRPELQDLSRRDSYLLSFNDPAFQTADVAHVLAGGQSPELSVTGRRGARWPGAPALGLVAGGRVVGAGIVAGGPALVVRMPRYPRGGVHGGHVVAVWNSGGHGYTVSLHFAGYPLADRIATVLSMARSAG